MNIDAPFVSERLQTGSDTSRIWRGTKATSTARCARNLCPSSGFARTRIVTGWMPLVNLGYSIAPIAQRNMRTTGDYRVISDRIRARITDVQSAIVCFRAIQARFIRTSVNELELFERRLWEASLFFDKRLQMGTRIRFQHHCCAYKN